MSDATAIKGFVDRVKIEGMLASNLFSVEDMALVDSVLAENGQNLLPDAYDAARSFSKLDFRPPSSGDAARALVPDAPQCVPLTVWALPCATSVYIVSFSFESIRKAAFDHFNASDVSGPTWKGVELNKEILDRLETASARPALAKNLIHSASDHFARHVLGLCLDLPGTSGTDTGRVVWVSSHATPAGSPLSWLEQSGLDKFADEVLAFVPAEVAS